MHIFVTVCNFCIFFTICFMQLDASFASLCNSPKLCNVIKKVVSSYIKLQKLQHLHQVAQSCLKLQTYAKLHKVAKCFVPVQLKSCIELRIWQKFIIMINNCKSCIQLQQRQNITYSCKSCTKSYKVKLVTEVKKM